MKPLKFLSSDLKVGYNIFSVYGKSPFVIFSTLSIRSNLIVFTQYLHFIFKQNCTDDSTLLMTLFMSTHSKSLSQALVPMPFGYWLNNFLTELKGWKRRQHLIFQQTYYVSNICHQDRFSLSLDQLFTAAPKLKLSLT